jgi:hypothetical protein
MESAVIIKHKSALSTGKIFGPDGTYHRSPARGAGFWVGQRIALKGRLMQWTGGGIWRRPLPVLARSPHEASFQDAGFHGDFKPALRAGLLMIRSGCDEERKSDQGLRHRHPADGF